MAARFIRRFMMATIPAVQLTPLTDDESTFYHPSLQIRGPIGNQSLYVTKDVKMGTLLLKEHSLFCFSMKDNRVSVNLVEKHMQNLQKRHPEFVRNLAPESGSLWEKFQANNDDSSATYVTNFLRLCGLSGWNTKINHGLPQNVFRKMTPKNNIETGVISYDTCVYASQNLAAGTELLVPYFDHVRLSLRQHEECLESSNIPVNESTIATENAKLFHLYRRMLVMFDELIYFGFDEEQLCTAAESALTSATAHDKDIEHELNKIKRNAFANGGINEHTIERVREGRSKNYMKKIFGTSEEAYDTIIQIMDDI